LQQYIPPDRTDQIRLAGAPCRYRTASFKASTGRGACTDSLAHTFFPLVVPSPPQFPTSFLLCLHPNSHEHTLTDDLKCGCRHVWHVCQHYTRSIKSQRRLLQRKYGERRRQLPRHRHLCRISPPLFLSKVLSLGLPDTLHHFFHSCETIINPCMIPTGIRGD